VAERVLTLRELNRATLARQLLLERKRLSPKAVIERLVGMQAQWSPAPYVGIWTRTTSFRRETLERDLARGSIVMRAAISESGHADQWPDSKLVAPTVRALAEKGPTTSVAALALIEREHGLTGLRARRAWRGGRMRAHVLHDHLSASWDAPQRHRFVALEEPEAHDPVEARAEIVRRYLAAFGPASRQDIDAWSMMRQPQIRLALDRLEPLRRFRDENGRELLDVPRGPLPDAEVPAPVRFLPKWDNVLLSFADRTRVLPEKYRKKVISQGGDVKQTFLVDGLVAGIWELENGRVVLQPFAKLSRATRQELEGEAARLEKFVI
jgi:hypothetical protein